MMYFFPSRRKLNTKEFSNIPFLRHFGKRFWMHTSLASTLVRQCQRVKERTKKSEIASDELI